MAIFTEEYCVNMLDEFNNRVEEIEFTPEQIQKICEDCKSIPLSIAESYLIEASTNYKLNKIGLNGATPAINAAANEIVDTCKAHGINSESKKKIHNIISDMFKSIANKIDASISKNYPKLEGNSKNIQKAYSLIGWRAVIEVLLSLVLNKMLGGFGYTIYSYIAEPIISEAAKAIAVKGNFDKEYIALCGLYAMTPIVAFKIAGAKKSSIAVSAKNTVVNFGLNAITQLIQHVMNSDKFKDKFNIDKNNKDSNDKCTFASYIISTLIHSSWKIIPDAVFRASLHI